MEGLEGLYSIIYPVNDIVIDKLNRKKAWKYGYNKEHDIIVISKTGQIGEIYEIGHLKIALPKPEKVYSRSNKKEEQYWEAQDYPKELKRIKSVFEWDEYPDDFKDKWSPYIEEEFRRRDEGFWFKNNGVDTFITGSHYMYLQWSHIDIGLPDFREANRIRQIHWEACKADDRCYGQLYVKIRRSGFSSEAVAEGVNLATISKKKKLGMMSKTGSDAKDLFVNKLVPISAKYPFFFKPIQSGMDKPKTELVYDIPAERLTKKKMKSKIEENEDQYEGLETSIDWKANDNNAYDGQKLFYLIYDESSKLERPNDLLAHWRVVRTCHRLGKKIIGKTMMGSTVNPLNQGGEQFQTLYKQSNPLKRGKNGQTTSGLYRLFIPMDFNTEGYIDRYGHPVIEPHEEPILGIDGEWIEDSAVEWWENECENKKDFPDELNEFYRQYPRTIEHAFRDEAKNSLFNLVKIYEQIDFNNSVGGETKPIVGNFEWEGGIKDSVVRFVPNNRGKFQLTWIPPFSLQNRIERRGGMKYPANEEFGAFGCDSYDISGTVDGKGSKGSLHGLTKFTMSEQIPSSKFFLRYNARPQTADIFFEDVLMALIFYGMPMLAENNKPRLLYHLKKRGYRGYSMNRPDKLESKLSVTEREIGGIPNNSEDIKQAHAAAIEAYITDHVGVMPNGEMGDMYFNETLNDWASFDLNKRTKHDDSISSGLAIMACNRLKYRPTAERSVKKISFGLQQYKQEGNHSIKINN